MKLYSTKCNVISASSMPLYFCNISISTIERNDSSVYSLIFSDENHMSNFIYSGMAIWQSNSFHERINLNNEVSNQK